MGFGNLPRITHHLPVDVAGVAALPGGDVLTYDGTTLARIGTDTTVRWGADLPGVRGRVALSLLDDYAVLISTGGDLAVVSPFTGACRLRLTAAPQDARLWSDLRDGTLYVLIGQTLAALDWQSLTSACA